MISQLCRYRSYIYWFSMKSQTLKKCSCFVSSKTLEVQMRSPVEVNLYLQSWEWWIFIFDKIGLQTDTETPFKEGWIGIGISISLFYLLHECICYSPWRGSNAFFKRSLTVVYWKKMEKSTGDYLPALPSSVIKSSILSFFHVPSGTCLCLCFQAVSPLWQSAA